MNKPENPANNGYRNPKGVMEEQKMAAKSKKNFFVKNVSNPEDDSLVYVNKTPGKQWFLAFSKRQHQQKIGDLIALVQKGKVTHIVKVVSIEMKDWKDGSRPHFGFKVETLAIISKGLATGVSSLSKVNLKCLCRNTNLVSLKSISNQSGTVKKGLLRDFKRFGKNKSSM